ncbi:hypothetical protein [Arenibacter certesii]|uniref:Tetratricopeptide repeat protein n=1 Tax=Arenibacter certesii TaxID=228955 RepID=A0A918IX85_9FLAO|nr:hypothetical protein [Arenibacter certesii]GGW36371.1 hypothetical protein GCM10007383_21650 [Arenibacter certesii]
MRNTILILYFTGVQCFSQNAVYDSLYHNITKELLPSQPSKALIATKYLEQITSNDLEKAKGLGLRAYILGQQGLKLEAIKVIEQANNIVSKTENHLYKAHINGLLSSLSRESGTLWTGKKALNKAIKAGKKITCKNESFKFQGNLQQELAYYAMDAGAFNESIAHLQLGIYFFNSVAKDSTIMFHLAKTNMLIGKNFLQLQKVDSAFFYYQKAKHQLQRSQYSNSSLRGFIFNGLGVAYMKMGDYECALVNLENTLNIAETSNYYNLKMESYKAFQEYYKTIKDIDNYIYYSEKSEKLSKLEAENRKKITNELLIKLEKRQEGMQLIYRKKLSFYWQQLYCQFQSE